MPGQGDMHSVFKMGHVYLVSPAQVYLRGFRLVKLSSDTLDDAQRVRLVAIFFDIIFLRAILNSSQSTSLLCLNRLHLIYLRRMALFGIGVAAALCMHSFPQLIRCYRAAWHRGLISPHFKVIFLFYFFLKNRFSVFLELAAWRLLVIRRAKYLRFGRIITEVKVGVLTGKQSNGWLLRFLGLKTLKSLSFL